MAAEAGAGGGEVSEVIQGEKPTEEEIEAILAQEKREKRRPRRNAKNKADRQKFLLLLSKETLTDEEREWLGREKARLARVKIQQLEKRRANPELTKKIDAEARLRQKDKIKERRKALYWKNSEAGKRASREYYASLTDEQMEKRRRKHLDWRKNKAKTDPAFACLIGAATRIRHALNGAKKQTPPSHIGRFEKYFGCNKETLVSHLESRFRDGMTWENRGKLWQVDHIVPLSAGLGDVALIMRMNHFRNLQPLLVDENRLKRDAIPDVWPEGVPFTREEVEDSLKKIAKS